MIEYEHGSTIINIVIMAFNNGIRAYDKNIIIEYSIEVHYSFGSFHFLLFGLPINQSKKI